MVSSDVRNLPFGSSRRAGVAPTNVRSAKIDRLEWVEARRGHVPARLARGQVERTPVARGRDSTLHRAVDRGGEPAFVRRAAPHLVEAFAAGHAAVADLDERAGMVVPPLHCVSTDELWIERLPWATDTSVAHEHIDGYVCALLRVALAEGVVVGTGAPHALADGRIVCEDVFVARRLEADERAVLASVVTGLIVGDAAGVADAVAALCRARPAQLGTSAVRATLSLRAEWSPVSFGLSLHQVACAAVDAGPRSEPLVLLADELLHRLDLAHHHHARVDSLATRPRAVSRLVPLGQG